MRSTALALIAAMVAAVTACDGTETPKRPGERMFDTQQQALERAKGVEDTVRQQAEQQRQQIDRTSE